MHCQYRDCICSNIVGMHCSCFLAFCIQTQLAALHLVETWLMNPSPILLIECFQIFFPKQIVWCSKLLLWWLNLTSKQYIILKWIGNSVICTVNVHYLNN